MRRASGFLLALAMAGVAAACTQSSQVPIKSRDEAAGVLVSVNTAAPWEQVSDAMAPNFALTGDQALQQVAPITARLQEQVLNAFGLTVAAGLPHAGPGGTTQPGTAPQPPSGIPAGGQLPTAPSVGTDIGLDPILKYKAALGLYQTVQEMNREVQYAAARDCYVPYLVILKFAVMPYRNDLPYDLHTRISFFKGTDETPQTPTRVMAAPFKSDCENANRLPHVVPILVTDDIERSLTSRAVETARQIGLALSFMFQGVGGNVGANSVNQTLDSRLGQDINSRMTVTRQSDNTLYARIGASAQGTRDLALVGQTYDVSLLLLVPQDYFLIDHRGHRPERQIQITAYTEFHNPKDGTILAERSSAAIVQQADGAMREFLAGDELKAWEKLDAGSKFDIVGKLTDPIQRSVFDWGEKDCAAERQRHPGEPSFVCALDGVALETGASPPPTLANAISIDGFRKSLWTRLSVLLTDSAFKGAFFVVRSPSSIEIPAQTVLIMDDGKDKAQIQLSGVTGDSARTLTARLVLAAKGMPDLASRSNDFPLAAQSIALDSSAHVLTLTFPSPAKWGLTKIDPEKSYLDIGRSCSPGSTCPNLRVSGAACAPGVRELKDAAPPARLACISYLAAKPADAQSKPAETPPSWKFSAIAAQIVADAGGNGSVSVTIDKYDAARDGELTLTIEDVEARAVSLGGAASIPVANKQVKVPQNTTAAFQLFNLRPPATFTITAESKKDGKSTGSSKLTFTVVKG